MELIKLELLEVVILVTDRKHEVIGVGCGRHAKSRLVLTLYQLVLVEVPLAGLVTALKYDWGSNEEGGRH